MTYSAQQISEYSDLVGNRYERIIRRYIKDMAEHIRSIGTLTPEQVFSINQMAIMTDNITNILGEISKQSEITYNELIGIYKKVAKEEMALAGLKNSTRINEIIKAMSMQTKNTFMGLSQTTLKSLQYNEIIDEAVSAVISGIGDTKPEIMNAVINASKSKVAIKSERGIYIEYASGARRRLDGAVRMNVMQGFKQTQDKIRQQIGREIGADGVEIDAHGMCAPDHIDVQGKRFSLKDYNNLELDRPISTCNCRHTVRYIVMKASEKTYSSKELKQLKKQSEEKLTIFNNTKSRYEWGQIIQSLDLSNRKINDIILGLDTLGVEDLTRYYDRIANNEVKQKIIERVIS